jgi:hypothetical protein
MLGQKIREMGYGVQAREGHRCGNAQSSLQGCGIAPRSGFRLIGLLDRPLGTFIEVSACIRQGNPCVDRSNNRTPSRSSSCAMVLETVDCPTRSCFAAPENEPASMMRTNASMAARRSTAFPPGLVKRLSGQE